jgi:hypothetical protein
MRESKINKIKNKKWERERESEKEGGKMGLGRIFLKAFAKASGILQ